MLRRPAVASWDPDHVEGIGPRAFISYAWDDAAHVLLVVRFADFLRDRCGVQVELDLDATVRPQDWPQWMQAQVRRADVILVVASPQYKRRAEEDDTLAPDEGRGVRWETRLITELSYADPRKGLATVLPVVLPGRSAEEIPFYLGPMSRTHYDVSEFSLAGAEPLVKYVTGGARQFSPGPLPVVDTRPTARLYARPRSLVGVDEFQARMRRTVPGASEPIVGRQEVVRRVAEFITDDSISAGRILVIEGRGGIGKTRVALEGAGAAGTTLVAGAAVSLDSASLGELPLGEPTVLIVDDAHRSPDLSGLAALVGDARYDRIKLVLTVRPGLADAVLIKAGLDRLPWIREELPGLDRGDVESIVVGRGFDNPVFVLAVIDLAEGVPLIAHAACDLAAAGGTFSWQDAADVIEDHAVRRLVQIGGDELRAAATALAALSTAERGADLAQLRDAVTGLPSDEGRLDALLADLADVGLADSSPALGGGFLHSIRPHLAAPVLVARALGPARVRIDIKRLLPILGRKALHTADGVPTPDTGGLLGIGKLVPATEAGPWFSSPPLAAQLEVLAQAALRAADPATGSMLGRAVLDLLPDGADVDTWRDVIVLAEQVVPAAPWLFDELRQELVRHWPPPSPPPVWGDMPGGGHLDDLTRLLQQIGGLVSRTGLVDCEEAVRLLLTAVRLAAPQLDTRGLREALHPVGVLVGQPLDPLALLDRRTSVLDAITRWTADQRAIDGPPSDGDGATTATARTALAALRPFLTFVAEKTTMGTSASADVVVLTTRVLPDADAARDTLTAAASAAAELLLGTQPAGPGSRSLLRELVRLPQELRWTAARNLPAGGGPLPAYAGTALRAAAAVVETAVVARWDDLPVAVRHAAAAASAHGARPEDGDLTRAAVANQVAADRELQRMLGLLPIEPDLGAYAAGGPDWERAASERAGRAMALAAELGWRAALDLLRASSDVEEDISGDDARRAFAERMGRAVPATEISTLLDRLVVSGPVPAEHAVLHGLISAHPAETVAALMALNRSARGASLALDIVWELPADVRTSVLDRVQGMIVDAADLVPDDVRVQLAGELAVALFRDPSGSKDDSRRRMVALGLDGPAAVTPVVLKYFAYGVNRDQRLASTEADPGASMVVGADGLVGVLARRLREADGIALRLTGDHGTAAAVALLATEAPDELADLMATRLSDPAHMYEGWPAEWTTSLLKFSPADRTSFVTALSVRAEAARAASGIDPIDLFDVDQILARLSIGVAGWEETLLDWAGGAPDDRRRAAVAVSGLWWSSTWSTVVSELLRAGLEPSERGLLLRGIDLTFQGPTIAADAQQRREALGRLEPPDHPAIAAFRTESTERIDTAVAEYLGDSDLRRRGYG